MSPSRGAFDRNPTIETDTDTKANIRSSNALTSAKRNLHYLFAPDSPNAPHPAHLRTRALLRSLRFIGIFFWRIVRYAKYALVGSLVAAVGASAFGGVVSGAAFVLASPTLATSLGRWSFRKMRVGEKLGVEAKSEVRASQDGVRQDGQWRDVQGARALPW